MLSKHFAAASSTNSTTPFRPTPLAAMAPSMPPLPPQLHSADYASWLCRPMAAYLPLNPSNLLAARLAGKPYDPLPNQISFLLHTVLFERPHPK
jgi:hypothetical protein